MVSNTNKRQRYSEEEGQDHHVYRRENTYLYPFIEGGFDEGGACPPIKYAAPIEENLCSVIRSETN